MPVIAMDGGGLLWNLLPDNDELCLQSVDWGTSTITVYIEIISPTAMCPQCHQESDRIHSRYQRRLNDFPCCRKALHFVVTARKFRCRNSACTRVVFCERLSDLTVSHARTTSSLTESHEAIGFALGGEAGARLAEKLDMPTSADTLLRRVKAAPDAPIPRPRYIGVDDWAYRKGQSYGTILIDLERRGVIDIFPGRDGKALEEWLHANPQVEVISRDRWSAFAEAANKAAPQAKQVADRWHLLKNLREAMERLFARCGSEIREALKHANSARSEESSCVPANSAEETPDESNDERETTVKEQARQAKRQEREERHRLVHQLRDQGNSLRKIARLVGLSKNVVIRYLRQETCPDWQRSNPKPTQLDPYATFIDEWVDCGGRNSADLYRELKQKGCPASYNAVRRYVNRRLGSTGRPGPRDKSVQPASSKPIPTARKLSYEILCNRDGTGTLNELRKRIPSMNTALDHASELASMIRHEVTTPLPDWLAKAKQSDVPELQNFARSLEQDEAAVAAAMTEPWSNGPVEGQVNRLKVIKRTMYGRAGMKLLRARVKQK